MEENNNLDNNNIDNDENKVKVKVEKHLWPDEVALRKRAARSKVITITVFSIVFLIFGLFLGKSIFTQEATFSGNTKFNDIEKIMSEDWYFGKDIENLDQEIMDQAIKGLSDFPDYDIHTYYLSKEEMQQFTTNLSGSYVGIGIQYYQSENGNLIVKRVFENSPAQAVGLLAGDILLQVDDTSLVDMKSEAVAELVMGKEGSQLLLKVLRDNKEKEFTLTRATVLHSVFGEVKGDAGYIELDQFGESTAEEVLVYLKKFENKQDKLILDLRDNGGGYLNSVVDIASYLIDEDEIVLITENNKGKQFPEYSNGSDKFKFEKIVILVNENTASASEVLTAALMEHLDNVTVVGTNTYGKGTVQQSRVFTDGSAMKYTTAEWLTPNGSKINKVGIMPDKEVNLHPILTADFAIMEDNTSFAYDSVSLPTMTAQSVLDFLGYDVKRNDGYFDKNFETALKAYQTDSDINPDGILSKELYDMMLSRVIREWNENALDYDTQLDEALVIIGE